MANNIEFHIGSTFSGEGFQQANQALNENRKEINSSVRGLGQLAQAFGEISPTAGKAVSAVTSFIDAFAKGGLKGGAIQIGIMAITEGVKLLTDYFEACERRVKMYADMVRENLLGAFSDGTNHAKEMQKQMDALTQSAQNVAAALQIDLGSKISEEIYKVNVEKLQSITDDMTEESKALVEAMAAQKIALIKANGAIEEAAIKEDAARTAYLNEMKKLEEVTLAAAKAEELLNIARQDTTYSQEDYKKCVDANAAAQTMLTAQTQKTESAHLALQKAMSANAAAHQNLEVVTLEQSHKVAAATDKQNAAIEKEMIARNDAALKIEEEMKKRDDLKDAIEKEIIARNDEALKASKDAIAFQEFLDGQRERLQQEIDKRNSEGNDGTVPVKVENADDIGSSAFANVNWDPITSKIEEPRKIEDWKSVNQIQRERREKDREERDQWKELSPIRRDTTKYMQLAQKPDSWLSKRDRDFMTDYKTKVLPQLPKDLAKQLLGDSSKHLLNSDTMTQLLKKREVIDAWLGSLGLK